MLDSGPENQDLLHPVHSPDWDTIAFDVHCSRCGYNLRTLTRPKCPECGLAIEWSDVLDRAAHRSDFLFEHNWRTRPVRSLLMTLTRSFRPRKFWAGITIHHRVNRAVLWAHIMLAIVSFPLVLHGTAWCVGMLVSPFATQPVPFPSSSVLPKPTPAQVLWHYSEMCRELARAGVESPVDYSWILGGIAFVILTAFLVLRVMWQTLAKYKILGAHVLRVVAYAALPAATWTAILLFVQLSVVGLLLIGIIDETIDQYLLPLMFLAAILVAIVPFASFLSAGLEIYLHLPRPRVTAAVATIVAGLAMFTYFTVLAACGVLN